MAEKRATICDVAALAGVSTPTASSDIVGRSERLPVTTVRVAGFEIGAGALADATSRGGNLAIRRSAHVFPIELIERGGKGPTRQGSGARRSRRACTSPHVAGNGSGGPF